MFLDSDHVSLIQRGGPEGDAIRLRMNEVGTANVVTSVVSFEEQSRGWLALSARSRTISERVRAYDLLLAHLTDYCAIEVLSFDADSAHVLSDLLKLRLKVGTMDLRIAAVALQHGATVVTRNIADFRRIPGLQLENWAE
jgi:tRNA(fMet)-specific endonuclease VapC